jgi:MFS superfamily sulfate permease-like transporter
MFLTGALLALSVLLLLWKLPSVHAAALRHPAFSDISITVGVVCLGIISTSFIGLITGVIAGVLLSMYFTVAPRMRAFSMPKRREKVINPLKPPTIRRKEVATVVQQSATTAEIQEYINQLKGEPRRATEQELLALLSAKHR